MMQNDLSFNKDVEIINSEFYVLFGLTKLQTEKNVHAIWNP